MLFAGRILALACAALVVTIAVTSELEPLALAQYLGMVALLLVGALASRRSGTLLVLGYVFAFLVFVQLRTVADGAIVPTSFHYVVDLEQLMFLGGLPTVWLQDLLYVPGRVGPHDAVLTAIYISYFAAPHLAVAMTWLTRRDLFPLAATAVAATFLIGLVFYFLIPTAPPWLASQEGVVAQDVHRVVPELSAVVAGDAYENASAAVGANDVAAMPSLHTALTCIVGLILASYGRTWRAIGIAYLGLMALALVYLGEHYVIDEIAGIALAIGVWRLVSSMQIFASKPDENATREPVPVADTRAA